jgi:hypothetical protein
VEPPRNLADMSQRFVEIEMIDISEWHPERDGRGQPTQVHVLLQLKGQPETIQVLRFHGPETLAHIVNALLEHGTNVFGRAFTRQIRRRPSV